MMAMFRSRSLGSIGEGSREEKGAHYTAIRLPGYENRAEARGPAAAGTLGPSAARGTIETVRCSEAVRAVPAKLPGSPADPGPRAVPAWPEFPAS